MRRSRGEAAKPYGAAQAEADEIARDRTIHRHAGVGKLILERPAIAMPNRFCRAFLGPVLAIAVLQVGNRSKRIDDEMVGRSRALNRQTERKLNIVVVPYRLISLVVPGTRRVHRLEHLAANVQRGLGIEHLHRAAIRIGRTVRTENRRR